MTLMGKKTSFRMGLTSFCKMVNTRLAKIKVVQLEMVMVGNKKDNRAKVRPEIITGRSKLSNI